MTKRPAHQKKPWAVLAYTVADDPGHSLDATVKNELKSLCDAADFGQVSIAAQVDFKKYREGVFRGSLTSPPPESRDFEEVRAEDHPLWRKILGGVERSTVRVLVEQEDLNAAGAGVLQDFLQFGQKECPADRYVVFFYGHAYGPMGLYYDSDSGGDNAKTLRLNELAGSIRKGGKADVVVFRDCFMNTLECAYQLRSAARFMIATQSLAPIAGIWPWRNFLRPLKSGTESTDAARVIAEQLGQFLDEAPNRGPFAEVPYSLLDLSVTLDLVAPMKALVRALEDARTDPRRRSAAAAALEGARIGFPDDAAHPGDPALIDVPTMCDGLQALERDPVAAPARALGNVVRGQLIKWHHTQQPGTYQGVSLYYKPVTATDFERSYIQSQDEESSGDAAYYRKLTLNRRTGWHRIALKPLAL